MKQRNTHFHPMNTLRKLKATYWLSSQVTHFSVGEIGFLAHCKKTLRLPTNDIEQVLDFKRQEKKTAMYSWNTFVIMICLIGNRYNWWYIVVLQYICWDSLTRVGGASRTWRYGESKDSMQRDSLSSGCNDDQINCNDDLCTNRIQIIPVQSIIIVTVWENDTNRNRFVFMQEIDSKSK
jgi:hypothetical protein